MENHTNIFMSAFRSLKHQVDMLALTTYQREEILRSMVEMKMTFENAVEANKKKK